MADPPIPILPEHKRIARHVAAAFGGAPRVVEYANTAETLSVGILSCRDRPGPGVTSYSTIKLSSYPMPWGQEEYPARIELAGACENDVERFPNLLASAAFEIMDSGELYHPGSAIVDVVRQAGVSTTLPHLYLTAPFLWGQALAEFDAGEHRIAWLLGVPISDAELAFLRENGDSALERRLEENRVDVFDPRRPSTV